MTILELPLLKSPAAIFHVALVLLLSSGPLTAQNQSNADLVKQIEKRDAIINDLLRRVESLEQQVSGAKHRESDGQVQSTNSSPTVAARGPGPAGDSVAQAPPERPEPGTLEVDERAADRALERTLTIQGALLLPKGVKELEPYTVYARRDTDFPVLLSFEGGTGVGSQRIERHEYTFGLRGAVGLPFESQLEIDIPYDYTKERRTRSFTGIPLDDFNEHGSSIGDIRIGIAKTLLREAGWRPDLLTRLTWDTDTGDDIDNGIPLGNGFNEIRLAFTGLKRQDPLAFTATVSYGHTLEKNDLQPGDELGFNLGVSMASSPSTSLSIAIAQSFRQDFRVDNNRVDGSSTDSAILLFGASSVLGRHTLLAVSAGIGLTDDAPDYTLSFSLPIRFW
jgi:hypothetical protein